MPATIDGNQNYKRYDENNVEVAPQPASTPGTVDPGTGWTTQPYLNFDGDYVRHDEDNNIAPAPQPYQKRDKDGNPIATQPYVRRDENNNPV